MAGKYDIGPRIGIEGEVEYRKQIENINNSMRLLGSEMERNIAIFDGNADSMEALTATSKNLEKQVETQRNKVSSMQDVLEKAKKEYGENSSQVSKYQTSLNKAETSLIKTEKALNGVNDKLEEAKKKGNDSTSVFHKLSQNTDKLEGALKKTSIAIGALIAGMVAAVKGTEEFRMDFAKLETNAELAGIQIEKVTQELTKLQAITGETDSNIEALSNLMQAGFKGSDLTRVVNELSGAVIKFPDTLKIESLADSLQETLATGEATGQFGEMLERMNINLDTFNSRLQRCTSSAQEQNYIFQTLSNAGLSQAYELYRKNNEELFKGAEMQIQFQLATAQMGESLTKAFVELSPVLAPLIDGFSKLIGLISEVPPEVLAATATFAMMIPVALGVFNAMSTVTSFMGVSMNPMMIKTTFIILAVVAALAALAAIIAVIQGRGKELQNTMRVIGNSTSGITGRLPSYESGTSFHTGGLALVGERGPEIVDMPRGSAVYTAGKTRQLMFGSTNNNYYVTIDAKNVREFNDIVRIANNQKISRRMGYTEG